eukprot:1059816-Lingulodinium_polyedra.AAC.1
MSLYSLPSPEHMKPTTHALSSCCAEKTRREPPVPQVHFLPQHGEAKLPCWRVQSSPSSLDTR